MARQTKRPVEVEKVKRMRPKNANSHGNVFGGDILKYMDEAASIAAERYAEENIVTASMDRMIFEDPVYTDDLLVLNASVDYVGDTSMIVSVDVHAEEIQTGARRETGSAYLTFVALDDQDRPTAVPDLDIQTQEEEERYEAAEEFRDEILDDLGR